MKGTRTVGKTAYTYRCAECGSQHTYHAYDTDQADEQARIDGWSKRAAGWTCTSCTPYEEANKHFYQQEYVRCGKARCKKCAQGGQGHGPYWYEYWHEGNKTRKRYIGKELAVS